MGCCGSGKPSTIKPKTAESKSVVKKTATTKTYEFDAGDVIIVVSPKK